ncbi:MAG: peroxiredoxin [Thaumarchaeota archaeon]|nr:peroxiredoxin [Nitrososphaerota archaeon]
MPKVKVGDVAPNFSLPSQSGGTISLEDFRGKIVVLYFYPKDFTPGCTVEARTFRDNYETFKQYGAEIIGVSSDTVGSHQAFASECNLPYQVLSDTENKVRNLYGASSTLGLIPGRVTYIIDGNGVVRHVFSSQFNPKKHIDEAIKVLKTISSEVKQRASA